MGWGGREAASVGERVFWDRRMGETWRKNIQDGRPTLERAEWWNPLWNLYCSVCSTTNTLTITLISKLMVRWEVVCILVESPVNHGSDISGQTTIYTRIHTYRQLRLLWTECFWTVGGRWSMQRGPTQAERKHANCTHKGLAIVLSSSSFD